MKIMGHRVPSLLYVAVMVGIYAVASTVFGQTPAQSKYDGSYHGKFDGSFAGPPRDGIRRIFRGEWCHYRDRSRSGRGNRGFFRLGDFQRFTRGSGCHLQVYWRLPVVKRRRAQRSPFGSWWCAGSGQTGKGTWSADRQ